MLTFQQLYETAQEASGDTSSTTLIFLKRWLNQGVRIAQNALGRYWTRKSQTASLVASQRYYQMPEDAARVSDVIVTVSGKPYVLEEIASEHQWQHLINDTSTGAYPKSYFVRGRDEIGLYPTPSSNSTDAIEFVYEPLDKDMTADDYNTGTVTVTNGSAAVTGAGTTFTQQMIGRSLQITSGDDGYWYKISNFTSGTSITLENLYEGIGGAGKAYKIGEIPNLPGELHDSLIDYVMFRYSLRNKSNDAAEYKALWEAALDTAKERYAKKSSSGVALRRRYPGYDFIESNRDSIAT